MNEKEGEIMKKIFTSFFLCLSLLVACNQHSSGGTLALKEPSVSMKKEIPLDFIPKTYNIVSIGDSLTQGVGDSTKRGGYLPYLEELLEREKGVKEATFTNFGVSGNRTSQILNRLKTQEIRSSIQEADIVILTAGGNDVMKVVKDNFTTLDLADFEKEITRYEKTLTSIISTIKKENETALIGLVGLYNPFYLYFSDVKEMNLVMDKWNRVSQEVLEKYDNTMFVSIADIFRDSGESLLYSDYFHPNDKGYELMADRIFFVMQDDVLDQTYYAAKKVKEQNEN